jgi:hypothetical protein
MYWQRSEIIMAAVRSGLSFDAAYRLVDCLPGDFSPRESWPRTLNPGVGAFSLQVQQDADQVVADVSHGAKDLPGKDRQRQSIVMTGVA